MRITKFFNRYMAMERTPSQGGGVIASGATREEAIALCTARKLEQLGYDGRSTIMRELHARASHTASLHVNCVC